MIAVTTYAAAVGKAMRIRRRLSCPPYPSPGRPYENGAGAADIIVPGRVTVGVVHYLEAVEIRQAER